jgi:xylan 1,4-beta-xylosidase
LRERFARHLAVAALALPAPVIAGDWPDPTSIFDSGEHVAVTTSSGWAPGLRVLRSPDLASWRITGEVFRRPPQWVLRNLWAPEITRLTSGRLAVFYSALPRKKGSWYCIGVATAARAEGPWRDRGRPLRCGRDGSIDAFPVRDEQGRLNLLWKNDGNAFGRPTFIYGQRMAENGMRLLGRPKRLLRNTSRWEGGVIEAPAVIRRPDAFYMLYSGALCCTKRCRYAVGAARAPRLLGRWRKFAGNPILSSGNGWRCPGHTGLATDASGAVTVLFHAYRSGLGRLAGRQVLAAPLNFPPDGWPQIGEGRVPPAPAAGAAPNEFADDFVGPRLSPEWEWPLERVPGVRVAGGLELRAPVRQRDGSRAAPRFDNGLLAHRISGSRYVAGTVVDRSSLAGKEAAGLSAFGLSPFGVGSEALGISVQRRGVTVWRRDRNRVRVLARGRTPASSGQVHLRLTANGNAYRFEMSPDGAVWRGVGGRLRGRIEESARVALLAGGQPRAKVRFVSARLEE